MEFSIEHVMQSLWLAAPLLVMIAAGVTVLVADLLLPREQRWLLSVLAIAGVVLAFVMLHRVGAPQGATPLFMGALTYSRMAYLAQNVILGGGLFLLMLSPRYLAGRAIAQGEFYSLILFALMAMMALAASTELLTLFLNIELLSIALYVLVGMEKRNVAATEASFKYFLLGSFAAAFLLMGIAFVYGATGETTFAGLTQVFSTGAVHQPLFLSVGLVLMFVGFGFKLTLAPFHMYAPDVYQGAPTPVAALIATGSKVAVLAVFFEFVRVVCHAPQLHSGVWAALWAIAVASMVIGNFGAVVQPDIKRLLAYSSVAHSGYAIVPMVAMLGLAVKEGGLNMSGTFANESAGLLFVNRAEDAVAFYLLAYTLMTLLAFGVTIVLGRAGETRIAHYAGLGRRNPLVAVAMLVALLSLLGVPPTVGFIGKLQLFSVAVDARHYWLAVLGVLASVASAFYYLQVAVTMFMREPEAGAETAAVEGPAGYGGFALAAAAVAVFLFAVMPALYLLAA